MTSTGTQGPIADSADMAAWDTSRSDSWGQVSRKTEVLVPGVVRSFLVMLQIWSEERIDKIRSDYSIWTYYCSR